LHRRCQVALGYGPKVFQRIMRLQRVRWLASTSLSTSLTWLAMESGYADQAHLCRDARSLTGQSPTRLLPRQSSGVALSDLFNSPLSS
jgi:AraC-like DNA-binding protein